MKKLLFIPLLLCMAISVFSLNATKEESLASQFFGSILMIRESKLNKETLSKLLVQAKSECIKYRLDEKRVINALISKVSEKKRDYEHRKTAENKYYPLKLLLGVTACCVLVAYVAIQNFREAPQDIQTITNDLHRNGAVAVTATGSYAECFFMNKSADQFKVRSKLLALIQAKKNSSPFH